MICLLFRIVGTQLEAAYERRVTAEGLTYWAQHHLKFPFPGYGVDLAVHRKTQHSVDMGAGGGREVVDLPPPPPLQQTIHRRIRFLYQEKRDSRTAP